MNGISHTVCSGALDFDVVRPYSLSYKLVLDRHGYRTETDTRFSGISPRGKKDVPLSRTALFGELLQKRRVLLAI